MSLLNLPPLENNNLLKKPSREISPAEILSKEFQQLIADMTETMRYWRGVGLAAVQIEKPVRLIIVFNNEGDVYPLFNPQISHLSKTKDKLIEGCLSLPGVEVKIERPVGITVEYLNETGENKTKKVAGLEARIIQHEVDHTNGIIITDHGPSLAQKDKHHKM